MRAKTKLLLYHLLCIAEAMTRPTWRNLTDSFEGWAYRNGLHKQILRLEKQEWIESQEEPEGSRLVRLTDAGRICALGGRDPVARWRRRWDGSWRLILFDVPEARRPARHALRTYLRERGFGCLQKSVWITPDPWTQEREVLAGGPVDVQELILLEAQPGGGESDGQIVRGAWNFEAINDRYAEHRRILAGRPRARLKDEGAKMAFHRWICAEHEAWNCALSGDPLLPGALLPEDYAGRAAWNSRQTLLREIGERLLEFKGG